VSICRTVSEHILQENNELETELLRADHRVKFHHERKETLAQQLIVKKNLLEDSSETVQTHHPVAVSDNHTSHAPTHHSSSSSNGIGSINNTSHHSPPLSLAASCDQFVKGCFPCCFPAPQYYRLFWLKSPAFMLRAFQMSMLFQSLYLTLYILVYCHVEFPVYVGEFPILRVVFNMVYFVPLLYFLFWYAPSAIPHFILVTSIGPLTNHLVLRLPKSASHPRPNASISDARPQSQIE